ncbi:hypothetical protein [Archaeoglobus profundus]|uniref:Uncharacterized protein n=1 Tax=Archaeoglobus profundus (strain DSM 5631 / JCM 9629 / NBRC 100127 / Av18) TaxID=572546 RepID=D2RFC3_ARCPA|nr:hypothetical protein [Archaeoglobus profundus]ADB58817.1 hypothetical protein Arcpr_1773 [Archaeoglobus profundus DSM 5631]
MVDVTWDIIKAGIAIMAGTYAMGMLFLLLIAISAIIFSAIILGILKLAEGIIHVAKRIRKRRTE